MPGNTPLYFLDYCLPNEGEPEQTLEIAILRGAPARDQRHEIYVHTYLAPELPSRVRWANAEQMGISRDFLLPRLSQLPTLAQITEKQYLRDCAVVCFDADGYDPQKRLTAKAASVTGLKQLWQEIYARDEKGARCERLNQMLTFLDRPLESPGNRHYPPLLQRVYAMAAIYYMLDEFRSATGKRRRKAPHGGGLEFNLPGWPLPPTQPSLLSSPPAALGEISAEELDAYFSPAIYDCLDWHDNSIFVSDWVPDRGPLPDISSLRSAEQMTEFIFTEVFGIRMQMWVLTFYALYAHRCDYARSIAAREGRVTDTAQAIREDFSAFLLCRLRDFLNDRQTDELVRAIIRQGMQERSKLTFESFDVEHFQSQGHSSAEGQQLFMNSTRTRVLGIRCFYEINNGQAPVYRRYIISGSGRERQDCVDTVQELLEEFMQEIKEPFSPYWTTSAVQAWIRFVTGLSWSELIRVPRSGDSEALRAVRAQIRKAIEAENRQYIREVHRLIVDFINEVNSAGSDREEIRRTGTFMGVSLEFLVRRRARTPFLKRFLGIK